MGTIFVKKVLKIVCLTFLCVINFSLIERLSAEENSCLRCHGKIANEFMDSIHSKVGVECSACHGGNPKLDSISAMSKSYGFKGKISSFEIPKICASCHANVTIMRPFNVRTDQYAEYQESVHGQRLATGDRNVAQCASCHGTHNILKKDNPLSSVYRKNVPKTCSKCHSDGERMKQYKIGTGQYDQYIRSSHGKLLLEKGEMSAPNCADCHGIHGAAPPGVAEIENVCGQCHSNNLLYLKKSPHQKLIEEKKFKGCVSCHSNHLITTPTVGMFDGKGHGDCGGCHSENTKGYQIGMRIKNILVSAEKKMRENENFVKKIQKQGFYVENEISAINEAKTSLVQVVPVQHSLSPDEIKSVMDPALFLSNRARSSAVSKVTEKKFVKKGYVVFISFWFASIVLLSLFRKELIKKRKKEEMKGGE